MPRLTPPSLCCTVLTVLSVYVCAVVRSQLSEVEVLCDIIPAYRIRLPTEQEQSAKVRAACSTLLTSRDRQR